MVQPRKGRVERVTLSRADLAKTFARLGWVKEMWYEMSADSSEVCGLLYCRSLCLLGGVGGCLAHLPRPRPPVPAPYAILKPRLLVYYIYVLMYVCAHGELCSDGEWPRVCVERGAICTAHVVSAHGVRADRKNRKKNCVEARYALLYEL